MCLCAPYDVSLRSVCWQRPLSFLRGREVSVRCSRVGWWCGRQGEREQTSGFPVQLRPMYGVGGSKVGGGGWERDTGWEREKACRFIIYIMHVPGTSV